LGDVDELVRGNRTCFVGRQRELAELKSALAEVLSGHGRMVMVAGEPGIGKTRVARELASYAEAQGAQVMWGWVTMSPPSLVV